MLTDLKEPAKMGDDSSLRAALEVLSSEARLKLLREVRTPKTLKEIKLRLPPESGPDRGAERYLARQTVKEHLERLSEIGVVIAREAERPYGPTMEYVVNHQALFALAEEFRGLAKLRPVEAPEGATIRGPKDDGAFQITGPCLVLVHGLDEGRSFDLRPGQGGRREWLIGRRRGVEVSLDFDPFISSENARIVLAEGAYFVEDLPVSRNGTTLNFQLLPRGARQALRPGDLVGVGRSLLLFRA